jgi:hypothetical protein
MVGYEELDHWRRKRMNIIYTRNLLSKIIGVPVSELLGPEKGKEQFKVLHKALTEVFNAGRGDALHYPVPRSMIQHYKDCKIEIWSFEALDVNVLEVYTTDDDIDYTPIRFDNTYDSQGERRYVLGSTWNTLDAAVVEALAMKMDHNNAVDGQYANRVLGFD